MGRRRIYKNNSEKVATYRARRRERELRGPVAVPPAVGLAGAMPVAVWQNNRELRTGIAALIRSCERARDKLGIEAIKQKPWHLPQPAVVVGRLVSLIDYIEGELHKLAAR